MHISRALAVLTPSVAIGVAASADVHFFVNNPTHNSTDFVTFSGTQGNSLDFSVQFARHPEGPIDPMRFRASSHVVITLTGQGFVQIGDGSISGNVVDPGGIGEGLMAEPSRYLSSSGHGTTVELVFDSPVAGLGIMFADLFHWDGAMPSATIEAFDSAGGLLGAAPAFNSNFQFDYKYFMGVADDDARISRVRLTNNGVAGDTFYITHAVISTPPCPADFNKDGTVNSQDFFDFLVAFFVGC